MTTKLASPNDNENESEKLGKRKFESTSSFHVTTN